MLIYAYIDEYYRIHIDPTVTINSENENDYKIQFLFQQPNGWGKEFTLYGVFKPVNDIPVSFKCDENNQVTIPNLYYGRYKKLGIALRGVSYNSSTSNIAKTECIKFKKEDFVKTNENEYTYIIGRKSLSIDCAQILNICVYTDEQETILEPVDYGVKYEKDTITVTLNLPLEEYSVYNGIFNLISSSDIDNINKQKIVRTTDYYYVPVVMGAMQ